MSSDALRTPQSCGKKAYWCSIRYIIGDPVQPDRTLLSLLPSTVTFPLCATYLVTFLFLRPFSPILTIYAQINLLVLSLQPQNVQ
ncbi:hypothetical protein ACTXT7_009072 [Hymenolepis weldensis]